MNGGCECEDETTKFIDFVVCNCYCFVSDDVAIIGTGTTSYPGKTVKINSGDIANPNENTEVLVYYNSLSGYTYGDVSKIKIDNRAEMYVNHGSENYLAGTDFSVRDMMDVIYDCELILEDTDGDKDYDIINAEAYNYEFVEYRGYIWVYCKYGQKTCGCR